jgi:4-hydroxybenzoate polyprenyltransferase
MIDTTDAPDARPAQRWWTYLQERFPPLENGLLVAVFSLSALCHSALLRGASGALTVPSMVVAFGLTLLFFFLLRVADEFKDVEDDRRYRPERPVPRGLVSLRELGAAGAIAATTQLGLAAWVDGTLVLVLLGTWAYFGLMCVEFFVPDWLDRHPAVYVGSHMVVMPGIALLAAGVDWAAAGVAPPPALAWFLGASFFGGLVYEIGRKIRAPAGERTGVTTYSKEWGRARAVSAWLAVMVLAAVLAVGAAGGVGRAPIGAAVLGVGLVGAVVVALRFLRRPTPDRAASVEQVSGLWLLVLYGGAGLLPMVW